MKRIRIPVELQKMNEIFATHGYEAHLVGGAVRDILLGKPAADWDVATNASPQAVMRIFHRVIPTGLAHGTVTVLFMRQQVEVTTYRTDGNYSDGRRPDSVQLGATLVEDLARRDFTINAIAASLADGTIIDPFDGRGDLQRQLIRTVGSPRDRFHEDGLRPVRALRLSAQLGFSIEATTLAAISHDDIRQTIRSVSMERFRDELTKLLRAPEPSLGLRAMEETGVLALFIPELAAGRGVTQADARGFHEFDVFDHNVYACDGAPCDNDTVRLAALLHDVGKTYTRTVEHIPHAAADGIDLIHFHGHEAESTRLTRDILLRLRFPNAVIHRVSHLIAQHMFHYESNWSDAAVRRFLVRVGSENIDDLFLLRCADIYGMHRVPPVAGSSTMRALDELRERIARVHAEQSALSLKDLAVCGTDLLALGVPEGKQVGQLLGELFQCVLDDPTMNTREQLLAVAQRLFAQR